MNPRLRVLLDSRSLLEHSATDGEVAAMWEKAVQTLENSRRGLDPSVEFTVAYTAALQTAIALLYACGYRPSGRDHHHNAFSGALAVGAGELARAARELDQLRLGRHEAVYGVELGVPEAQMQAVRESTVLLMREARQRILAERPALSGELAPPPGQDPTRK
jgi:hypothetical protein